MEREWAAASECSLGKGVGMGTESSTEERRALQWVTRTRYKQPGDSGPTPASPGEVLVWTLNWSCLPLPPDGGPGNSLILNVFRYPHVHGGCRGEMMVNRSEGPTVLLDRQTSGRIAITESEHSVDVSSLQSAESPARGQVSL